MYHNQIIISIVFWCISLGCCCSKISCQSWIDYFSDLHECRSNGAVDRVTTEYLSYVPLFGFSNFYKGNKFTGWCQLVNGVMTVIIILATCYWHTHRVITDTIAVYISMFTIFLDLAKIIHLIAIGSADMHEITLTVISIVVICLCCCGLDHTRHEKFAIIPALLVTIITATLETLRDIYTAAYHDRDGNDCPFI